MECVGRDWTEAWYVASGFSHVTADNFHGVKDNEKDIWIDRWRLVEHIEAGNTKRWKWIGNMEHDN